MSKDNRAPRGTNVIVKAAMDALAGLKAGDQVAAAKAAPAAIREAIAGWKDKQKAAAAKAAGKEGVKVAGKGKGKGGKKAPAKAVRGPAKKAASKSIRGGAKAKAPVERTTAKATRGVGRPRRIKPAVTSAVAANSAPNGALPH